MSLMSGILGQSLCAFAFCWRLERRDGVTIGLTSHDRALVVDGLTYGSAPGMTPSAILRCGEGAPDLAELRGALTSAAISEADLGAGRWDGAMLMLHLTEWTDPGALWLELARGTLGHSEQAGGSYNVALRGAGALLERPVAPTTSPTCRARLGDGDCRVDLRRYQQVVRVTTASGDAVTCAGLVAERYPFGEIRWLQGANVVLVQMVIDQDGDTLFLAEPPHFPILPETLALVTQGCDKRLATCAARFANVENFRGEPHLPGMDLLTRYPGS